MTQQHYESWRISYQSSEAAARSAWQEMIRLHHRVNELEAQLSAIGAGGVEPLRKPASVAVSDEREAFEKWARWCCYDIARASSNAQYESNITEQVWQCWKARAALAATPAAAPVVLPEPAAYIGSWRPDGMLVDHSVCGFTVAELKHSSPSSSFKALYTEEQVRALQAGVSAPAAPQAHPADSDILTMADALLVQRAADARDAARYRWLRSRDLETMWEGGVFSCIAPENIVLNGEDLDEAVDTALEAQAKQGEQP